MSLFQYVAVCLLLIGGPLCVILLVRGTRRIALKKVREQELFEANQPLEVWICRYCGFMSFRPFALRYRRLTGRIRHTSR